MSNKKISKKTKKTIETIKKAQKSNEFKKEVKNFIKTSIF